MQLAGIVASCGVDFHAGNADPIGRTSDSGANIG
jgi:hypothetical protein